jgi:hypothetical protein
LKITYITAWKLINLQATKNCPVKHDGSDDNALKLTKDEGNDWLSLQTVGVWLDYDM